MLEITLKDGSVMLAEKLIFTAEGVYYDADGYRTLFNFNEVKEIKVSLQTFL